MQQLYKLATNAGLPSPDQPTTSTIARAITTAPATSVSGADLMVNRSGQMGGASFDFRRDGLLDRNNTNLVVWEHGKLHTLDRFVRNFDPDDFYLHTMEASQAEPAVTGFTGVDTAALTTDLKGNALVAYAKHIHAAEQELRLATCEVRLNSTDKQASATLTFKAEDAEPKLACMDALAGALLLEALRLREKAKWLGSKERYGDARAELTAFAARVSDYPGDLRLYYGRPKEERYDPENTIISMPLKAWTHYYY